VEIFRYICALQFEILQQLYKINAKVSNSKIGIFFAISGISAKIFKIIFPFLEFFY
jgi:hypothetical protein